MNRVVAFILVTVLTATSCGGSGSVAVQDPGPVYAAALMELVTRDNTFGAGHRFIAILVQQNYDPAAGDAVGMGGSADPLDADVRAAIAEAFTESDVRWIDDPFEWITDELMPVLEGSVIVGVGVAQFDDEGATVPVSLWCGGVCGLWATYRLATEGDVWVVTGYEGQIAIS